MLNPIDIWILYLVLNQILMHSFIKDGGGSLQKSSLHQLAVDPDLWIMPFKGKVLLALGVQRQTGKGIF